MGDFFHLSLNSQIFLVSLPHPPITQVCKGLAPLAGKGSQTMVSNFPYPDGKAVPFHLSLFNFNSSGKKLWCWYLSPLFNLLGCQANEIASSMLYTKCFYVASEAKRLFSSLEAHRPGLWLSWLIWWIHILCTLKGNSHSPLPWCNIKTYCKKSHPSRLLNYSELLSLPPHGPQLCP